jgi:Tol biopolymer transport system component
MALDGTLLTKNEGRNQPEMNCPGTGFIIPSPNESRYAYYGGPHYDHLVIGEYSTGKTINVIDFNNIEFLTSFTWVGNHKIILVEKDHKTIDLIDVETGTIKNLEQSPSAWTGFASDIKPSPDGKYLAIETGNSESDNLFLVASDGSGSKNMTADLGIKTIYSGLAWSPDSSRFAFYAYMDNGISLVIEKADGSGLKVIEKNLEPRPYWSPDGNHIAFACTINSSDANICLTDADGNAITSLPVPGFPYEIKWSPDSKKIAFFANMPDKHHHANILLIDSGNNREIFAFDHKYGIVWVDQFFRWSPDSNWLLILTAGRSIGYVGSTYLDYSPVLCDLEAKCHDYLFYNSNFAVIDAEWALPGSTIR